MHSFPELPLVPYLQERIAAAGFTTPTPVQGAAIPPALAGKDVLATAQTGTGKTLAFLLPIVDAFLRQRGTGSLVLLPTRELAMQVAEEYEKLRGPKLAPAAVIVGGVSENTQLAALRAGARLVVATPGRLQDFLERRLIGFGKLRTLVLDEADRMLDMGFLPAIRRILAALPAGRQTLCFSATLENSVAGLVSDCMKAPVRVAFGSTHKPVETVRVQALAVVNGGKQEALQRLLAGETGRCLIFARTKRGTERLAKRLAREGFTAAMIHGDRSQSQRNAALSGFQTGRYQVLVATDIASRGIHVEDIAHVINYDLPEIPEDFIHRVGRTGRAGESGVASTLYEQDQIMELRDLERTLGIRMEWKSADGEAPRRRTAPAAATSRMRRLPGEVLQNYA